MRHPLPAILAIVMMAGGCAGDVDVIGGPGVAAVATVTPAAATGPTPEPTATPTAAPAAPPSVPSPTAPPTPTPTVEPASGLLLPLEAPATGGLMTTTGIPVEILAVVDGRNLVRTPCGDTAVLDSGEPIADVEVVLDPGHGGPVDTGAVGANGLVERDLNLRLAVATEAELGARGITVATTRTRDYHTLLSTRSAFADAVGARALVSIHHNAPAAIPSDAPGTEVFVQSDSPESRRLGGVLYATVFDALSTFDDVAWTTASDAGVLRVLNTRGSDAYGMIRRPATPTALVELGYLNNPTEAALMATQEYIDVAAVALADGIEAFLRSDDPGRGYVEEPRVFDPAFAPGADVCTDPALE